jgi:hypothetical protein
MIGFVLLFDYLPMYMGCAPFVLLYKLILPIKKIQIIPAGGSDSFFSDPSVKGFILKKCLLLYYFLGCPLIEF